jgi:hypothetical protein
MPRFSIVKTTSARNALLDFSDYARLPITNFDPDLIDQIMEYFNAGPCIYCLYGVQSCSPLQAQSDTPFSQHYGLTCENFTAAVLKLFNVPDPFPNHIYYIVFKPKYPGGMPVDQCAFIPLETKVCREQEIINARYLNMEADLPYFFTEFKANKKPLTIFSYSTLHYNTASVNFFFNLMFKHWDFAGGRLSDSANLSDLVTPALAQHLVAQLAPPDPKARTPGSAPS